MTLGRLICPRCRAALSQAADGLACTGCGAAYPLVGGVPVLLPESLTPQQESQNEYFDAEFSRYAHYRPENWRLSFIRRISAALGLVEGDSYLDVGVGGSGASVIEAARCGVDATGCDLSLEAVARAQGFAAGEGLAERARFVVAAAELLPFADASFTATSAVAVLEHVEEDRLAAAELARVTCSGGRLWVTVPHAYRHIPLPLWPAYWWHDRRIGHKRHYGAERLVQLFEELGFRLLGLSFSGHPVKVVQLAFDTLPLSEPRRTRIWWKLEELDLRAERRRFGALQLSAVFERL